MECPVCKTEFAKAGIKKFCSVECRQKMGKYIDYQFSAEFRNYEWDLSLAEFIGFWQKECFYCGDKIKHIGLDRKDNLIGYVMNNIVPCCGLCNMGKRNLTQDDFITHCLKVARNQNKL